MPNTFVTNFSDVPTSGIKWAELKVGVWGGKQTRQGFANATLSNATDPYPDGYNLGLVYLNTTNPSSNVDCCGNGVYLIKYNCTNVLPLLNSNSITATINAWPDSSLASTNWLDSRVYGAVLIVVYEDGNCYTQYWINQGLLNLNYQTDFDADISWFNGTAYNFGDADLTLAQFAGTYIDPDWVYLNPSNAADSPYNLSNLAWNISKYSDYQLNNSEPDNVADANSTVDGSYISTSNFDFDIFTATNTSAVKDIINHNSNNYVVFKRGYDSDNDGEIYGYWIGSNNEGETYVSPFLAVLTLHNISTYDFSNYTEGVAGVDHHAYKYQAGSRAPSANNVPSTEFTSTEYNKIKTDDGTSQNDVTTTDGNFAAHRFVFNASCCTNTSNFDAFNVTWNGKGYHDAGSTSNGAYLYIWNFNTNAYEELANCDGDGTEKTLTGEKTTNLSNYINNGQVIVLAEQKTADDGRQRSHIETDYVKLLLKPKA